MTVWYQLFSHLNQRPSLRTIAFLILIVVLITTFFFGQIASALPSTTKTVNFQGRLMTAAGAVVADGHYNMQFKIYQDGAGTSAGNPGGSLQWTETYINGGGTNGVEVKNGFFSVSLGSLTSFGTSVDWDQDVLWLSMNVAGNAASCSSFGSAPCAADGEMLSMKRITATPYALNSGSVGGKSANDLVQLGQGQQTDATNSSSIDINKTGSGNLVQLQASGTDAFTVNNAGSIALGSTADQSISVRPATSGDGKQLTITAGSAALSSNLNGGDLLLQGGAGDGSGAAGGVIVKASDSDSTGTFQVQDAAGEAVLNVDTANKIVSIGSLKIAGGLTGSSANLASLWGSSAITGTPYNDGEPLNVGTTFKSDKAGEVMGVKFYNPYTNNQNGTDIGKLWACSSPTCTLGAGSGTELASVVFSADGSEGWKTALFDTPVTILPDTYYLVTYFSQGGGYYAAPGYFASSGVDRAPLHAPASNVVQNGSYATNAGFPTSTYGSANYWVDVAFRPSTTTDQISTNNDLVITSAGAMTVGPVNNSLKLQGSSIDITASSGGNVNVQGGDATASNSNGGSLILGGGKGKGTGADGLVVITTPTFATTSNDANCYSGGALVAASCSISAASLNSSAVVIVGFSADNQAATLPDPGIATAGRIMYVTAAGGSKNFTLRANIGDGAEQAITMRQNTTTTMLWNGSDWTLAGGSTSGSLQDAYNTSAQDAGGANVDLSGSTGGLTLRDNATTPVDGALLAIKGATDAALFSVTNQTTDATTQTTTAANVAVGGGGGEATLFTVDKAASAPTSTDTAALLGSMYYDTTVGKLQCYEAKGWGSCGSSPDIFVALSPEYTNAVMNGTDVGTITSDLCSDALNINDGTSGQPTVCGSNETHNFYKWNTAETTDQTRSIYVTYQLPATFDKFVSGSTSVMALTDTADATVSYQIYRDRGAAALVSCGALQTASTGPQTSWQTSAAPSDSDPANCDFQAGDSILFRINLSAANDANAYVSNLGFVFSNN